MNVLRRMGPRVRLAGFLGALAVAVSAFGGLVLPRLGADAAAPSPAAGDEATMILVRDDVHLDGCDGWTTEDAGRTDAGI